MTIFPLSIAPTTFTAITNGAFLGLVGCLLLWDSPSQTNDCTSALNYFPVTVLLCALTWFVYAALAASPTTSLFQRAIEAVRSKRGGAHTPSQSACTTATITNASCSRELQQTQDPDSGVPVLYLCTTVLTAAVLIWASATAQKLIGPCSAASSSAVWPGLVMAMLVLAPVSVVTGLLFLLKRKTVAGCIPTAPLRYVWHQYILAFPMVLVWLLVPFSNDIESLAESLQGERVKAVPRTHQFARTTHCPLPTVTFPSQFGSSETNQAHNGDHLVDDVVIDLGDSMTDPHELSASPVYGSPACSCMSPPEQRRSPIANGTQCPGALLAEMKKDPSRPQDQDWSPELSLQPAELVIWVHHQYDEIQPAQQVNYMDDEINENIYGNSNSSSSSSLSFAGSL